MGSRTTTVGVHFTISKINQIICCIGNDEQRRVEEEDKVSLHADANDNFDEPAKTREQLERQLRHTQKSAYTAGTFRNLVCQWNAFFNFMEKFKIQEWPITEHTLCLFAQHLAHRFVSAKSINNYVNGVCTLHALTGCKVPELNNIEVKLTMRGLMKLMVRKVRRAQPLTPEILLDMFAQLNMDRFEDQVFWAILLIGFFAMLRKSNLVADSEEGFEPIKQLTQGHISFQGEIAIIKVTWAKNIQNSWRYHYFQ